MPQPDQDLARTQQWPLRSYLELPAVPTSARWARLHAKNVLCQWRMEALTDTVELIVSEIVTNAIHASANADHRLHESGPEARARWMRFWLASDRHNVLIRVWDSDHGRPALRNVGPNAEAGRGLLLIDSLAAQWGCYTPAGQGGKIVWAVCAPLRMIARLRLSWVFYEHRSSRAELGRGVRRRP